jgi:PEP-CTERM motif
VWGDWDDGKHVFVYSGGTYTAIDVPGSTRTTVTGVNASGVVAGYYVKGSTDYGFVDDGGSYATIDVSGSTNTYVEGVNNSGQLTGYYSTYSSSTGVADYGFIATPEAADFVERPSAIAAAPEPSTWALLLAGFAGLGFAGRRKARRARTACSPA